MKNLIKVFGYARHIRKQLAILVAISVAMSILGAVQPFAFKIIVDELVRAVTDPSFTAMVIWYTLGGLLLLRIVNSVLNYFSNIYSEKVFTGFIRDLRHTILGHITELSIDYFEKSRSGEILQRAINNTSELANWFYSASSNFLGQIISTLLSLILIFVVDWRAGLLVGLGMAMFFLQQVPALRKTRSIGKENRKVIEKAVGYVQETISHIATVRSFGGEAGAVERHYKTMTKWRELVDQRNLIMQRNVLVRQITNGFSMVGAVGIIAYGVMNGTHTAGDILLISLYIQQITGSLWSLGRFFINTNEADITAERVVGMLETPPNVADAPDAKVLTEIQTIEFRKVSFKYPGKRKATLSNVSFALAPGETLALVGPSGTGKTTVTKLLLRFYDVSSGAILINGQDIRGFTQESLRRHMGVVMQDVALFNDSIESNIQLARPKAKTAAVQAAAKQAYADDFIQKLSKKYKTMVGERGVKLSGGEKQRVAIARAILKQPQLIVLDEATSALDSASEQQVQAGLQELMKDRTAIVIAHRLSTIMSADQIVVMQDGTIVEHGNHKSLAAKRGGLYAKLLKLQTKGFVKD